MGGSVRLGAGLTSAEAMVRAGGTAAGARRGGPDGRAASDSGNRGTIGGNLATASPAGDAVPPLHIEASEVECVPLRGSQLVPLLEFITAVKRNVLAEDELIAAVWVTPSRAPQTFMKVGPRNAMVIAVVSLAVSAGDELRASIGSASPRPVVVRAPRSEAGVSGQVARQRLRSTTCAGRPPTGAMRCGS